MDTDIETLVTYPMEADDWLVTVAIGGILLMLSVLVVPIFLVAGYLVRALRAGMDGADEPPVFDDWDELLREGFVASVITFVYQLIPTIVLGVAVGGSILAFSVGTDAGAGLGVVGLVGGLFVWWVLAMIFGYVGFANYARQGTFGAGFDGDVIRRVVTSRAYAVAWLYVIALQIVVGVVTGLLNVVPILGGVVGIFFGFCALIIASRLWGDSFATATGTQVEPTVGNDAMPA